MKTLKIQPNQSLLNTQNIKILKDGDVIEYYFDTELNGRRHEKVNFRGIAEKIIRGVYDNSPREVEVLKFDYISPDSFVGNTKEYATRDIADNWFTYCIYTNGWNPLHMVSVNGTAWEVACTANGLTGFLSEDDQIASCEAENIKVILDNVVKHEPTGLSSISSDVFSGLSSSLVAYPASHIFSGTIGINLRKDSLVTNSGSKFYVGRTWHKEQTAVPVDVLDFYEEVPQENYYPKRINHRIIVGDIDALVSELVSKLS